MRIPLTKYGLPQVFVCPVLTVIVMASIVFTGVSSGIIIASEVILGAVLIWILSFFRDPDRVITTGTDILLSPADGKITDIEVVEDEFVGRSLRIGIFLSIFNVHINRAPCSVSVEEIRYKKGKYKNAMDPESARVNEANDILMVRTDSPFDRLIVRQISGAIARRIVCTAGKGDKLSGGQRFGMIKFGSRTELYLPDGKNARCMVKLGDKVRAGISVLVRYEK